MEPTETDDVPALLAAFFRDEVLPRREALREHRAAKHFSSGSTGAPRETFFQEPLVARMERADFEAEEPVTPEALATALLELWRRSGVIGDPDLTRKLAELAFRLKSGDDFDAEPPPFIYTL